MPAGRSASTRLLRFWQACDVRMRHTGDGIKTIVPAKAAVKLACRLVPGQQPGRVLAALEAHIRRHSSPLANTTVTPLGWFAEVCSCRKSDLPPHPPRLLVCLGACVAPLGLRAVMTCSLHQDYVC